MNLITSAGDTQPRASWNSKKPIVIATRFPRAHNKPGKVAGEIDLCRMDLQRHHRRDSGASPQQLHAKLSSRNQT